MTTEKKQIKSGFNLSKKTTRVVDVKATEPLDGINERSVKWKQEFKIIPQKEWDSMIDEDLTVAEIVKAGTVRVEGFTDVDGHVLEHSDKLLDALVEVNWIVKAMCIFQSSVQGATTQKETYKALKRKN